MLPLQYLITIIFCHLIGDYFFQSQWMAMNKSKEFWPLYSHALCYTIPFQILLILNNSYTASGILTFIFLNMFLHLFTDFATSKLMAKYREANDMSRFFKTLGIDQAIHMSCLVLTYPILFITN